MMDGLEAQVRQCQLLAARQLREDLRVEVASRIQRRPAWPDDMARMENRSWETVPARLIQQVGLNCRLLDAIFAKWTARLLLGGGHLHARPMHPDRATVQKVLNLAT